MHESDWITESHRLDVRRHTDTMDVLKSFIERGSVGTLELELDRYGNTKCRIALTDRPSSVPVIVEHKGIEGIIALRAQLE